MSAVLTTDRWKKSRARIERRTMERKRIRFLLTLLALLALVGLRWYFGENVAIVVH